LERKQQQRKASNRHEEDTMHKSIFSAMSVLLGLGGPALAGNETWLVTEENIGGVKGAQGTWTVNVEGNKVSGVAAMQTDKGGEVTYKVEGAIAGGVYTITMNDRTDGKKGCVWSGHAPAASSTQAKGLLGYAECEGTKLIIRAAIVGQ
jgi:hypothetical protein